jgi:hypothetical protein
LAKLLALRFFAVTSNTLFTPLPVAPVGDIEMADEVSFDVYVIDDGSPVTGEEVTAFFTYELWPSTHSIEYTDEEGHAHFSSEHPWTPLEVEIHVRGEIRGKYPLEDGAGFKMEL